MQSTDLWVFSSFVGFFLTSVKVFFHKLCENTFYLFYEFK
ncbi:hypothetical protein LEP1GSC116_0530 [Leptospira interrogans serovar Icterohaemorrhagiae str. Verdun HP]|uniref:Uncharacterized protein n=1 Tax=Leptospira interrogans serovar Icterohaemorrhagiae str. Verdun HP TaxID=1049910 RepID=M6RHZ5_LEPIR|nr:hypothetical protein LEP1GSC116_0530 [Leptospira interrogans serovar Icterohaemorrhagiae str. Verdun HP]